MKRTLVLIFVLMLCFASIGSQRLAAAAQAWQPISGPTGGSVAAMAMSPNYAADHTVFAGLRGRGVYRTIDGGDTWQSSGLTDQVVIDLAIAPSYATDHTIFAAVGLSIGGYNIYRSSDQGVTWQPPYITPYNNGFKPLARLVISPDFADDHTVYALGAAETYKSTDGGQTFVKAGGWFATHSVTHLAISPAYAVDHTLFAAVQDDGLYKSIDGGAHWNPAALGGSLSALAISPDYQSDRALAAVTASDGRFHLSTDGGASWTTGALMLSIGGEHTLIFSPTFSDDHLMLAASSSDQGAYRTTDGGVTWVQVGWPDSGSSGFARRSIYAMVVSPDTAYDATAFAGTSSGIYRSLDRGTGWSLRNTGLRHLSVRSIAIAPSDRSLLLVGTSYSEHQRAGSSTPLELDGNLQLSGDGGLTWQEVSGQLDCIKRVVFSPDFANDHIALAITDVACQHGSFTGGIYRSTNSGQFWSQVLMGTVYDALTLSPNFAVDHTAWVYASAGPSGTGIFRSVDAGATWSLLTSTADITSLIVSPDYATDHTLFASTADAHLQKSIDGGLHWTPVFNHTITALAISPVYGASQTLYAAVKDTSGVAGDIYRSSDGGTTWQKLVTGIPATSNGQPATIAVLTFAADGSVLAGVTYGSAAIGSAAYRSVDGGATWQLLGSGLEASMLYDLTSTMNDVESARQGAISFYAGTSSGLWQIDQPQRDPTEPGTWDSSGPRGGRADVLALLPDFANDGIAFTGEVSMIRASEYGQGLFKSSDWGRTWRSVSRSVEESVVMGGEGVHGYAFSPGFVMDKTVFAATSRGLYKSTDGGDNWQWLKSAYTGFPAGVRAVVLAPDYPTSGHLMATGGWSSLVMSQDYGKTWSNLVLPMAGDALYSPSFAADHTIFANGYNVYRSTNRGLSWTQILTATAGIVLSPQFGVDHVAFVAGVSTGISKTIDGGTSWTPVLSASVRITMSPHFNVDQTVFGISNNGSNSYGGNVVYRSTDGGATWISNTLIISTTYIGALVFSPAFDVDHLVYAVTSEGLYRSTDGGATWPSVPDFARPQVSSLAFSPGWPAQPYLLAGTAQGIYRSIDHGTTWARMQGLASLSTSSLALSSDEAWWLAGTGNGVHASADQGRTWFPLGTLSAFVNEIAISPAYTTDHTLFAVTSCNGCGGVGIQRTTDNGATWQSIKSMNYSGALAISPQYATDHTIYTIGSGVQRSTDGGGHWSPVGTWLPFALPYQHIALPPNYPADGTIFAAGPGFWRLPPGETLWQPAASGLLSSTNVLALAVSPNYTTSQTLLALSSWQVNYDLHYGVLRSDDGGLHWQPSNVGVPDTELRGLGFSPNYAGDHTVYLTTNSVLYRSIDDGQSWTAIGSPPGLPGLSSVTVNRAGQVIVTSDAGVWRYNTILRDFLIDGDFEAGSGWQTDASNYSSPVSYTGRHALRLGIDNGSNAAFDSSAVQTITIPVSATIAQLSLRVYPASSETQVVTQSRAMLPANPTGDAQYATITVSNSTAISRTLFWMLSNAQAWQRYTFDLTSYAGQSLILRLGVINDGQGGQTAMIVDNAALTTFSATGTRVYLPVVLKN